MKRDWKKVADNLTLQLKSYAQTYGIKGFVVGVSGGIDSAVVSSLCARTGLQTVCLIMPIKQKSDETDRGLKHIHELQKGRNNVSYLKYDLSMVYDVNILTLNNPIAENNLRSVTDAPNLDLDFLNGANLRSRLRMCTLYYTATKFNLLVAGTGNKVEDFGVGFFTKYGDGGVDISPIGDLVKSEVYKLGKYLGVIQEILKAKPTDGLWDDGRTDEDQIGATYDELEWAMEYAEGKIDMKKKLSKRKERVLKIYMERHNKNSHKMKPIPIFKVS